MIIILMITLQLVFLTALPLVAWVYMYRKGTETRDMIFWGVVALFIPLLGPLAVILYTRRRDKQKRQFADAGS
ncbi:MAG: hypothetical protein OXG92_13335 [Chloroflexi bacterium]|nr:hypothetical protein [Chloroflexota bacterium]MCY3581464.1 hypothetical protein [Chloroflexota bacterium]MCY3717433.1 hypothetical protein [Chloroflexota bacterium]MDE2651215.1 hypothetical protein [Chloroflexota bacterium]